MSLTVVELRKKCKERKLKGYSKLKKSQLENLLDTHGVSMEQQKKKKDGEKLKRCPKGTRRNKKTGECEAVKAKQKKSEKEKVVSSFDRKKKIQQMKKKVDDPYDPIFAQQFDDWSDDDLQHAILLGKHYYLPKTLMDHVQTKLKQQHVMKDPMTGTIISEEKIKQIYKANKKPYKKIEKFHFDTANMNIKLERRFFKIFSNRPAQPFMQIILTYNPSIYKMKTKNLYFKKPDEILIGNVPMGISTHPGGGEVKALDASSTSEVIMSKIIEKVRNGKLFSNIKDNHLSLDVIPSLPTTTPAMKKWYNPVTRELDTTSKNSQYFKLLEEL